MAPSAAFALLSAVGVASALTAYRSGARRLYLVGKAVATAGFLAVALVGGLPEAAWSRTAGVALAASALGDVSLAGRGRVAFGTGLAAFTVAHLAYAVAFALRIDLLGAVLAGAALGLLAARPGWRALAARLSVPVSLRRAVAGYLVIVAVMLGLALAAGVLRGAWPLALGAVLVGGSDVAVARERFGRPSFSNKLVGLPTYYAGQLQIALQVAGA
jgi:uncharacterized membrane protein YhhN